MCSLAGAYCLIQSRWARAERSVTTWRTRNKPAPCIARTRSDRRTTANRAERAAAWAECARRNGQAGRVAASLANCGDDLLRQRRVLLQVVGALRLAALDDLLVLVRAALRLVELERTQHGRIRHIDP